MSYFAFWIEIEDYSEIEESVTKMYNLNKMLEENIKRSTNLSECIRKGEYKSHVIYSKVHDLNETIYNEKYEYINYLIENDLTDKKLSENEINNIWKPEKLDIVVNGNKLKPVNSNDFNYYASYNKNKREYDMYFPAVIKDLGITVKNRAKKIVEYNGKEYKIKDDGKLKKNEIHRRCTCSELEDVFKVKTRIDLENRTCYIDS